MWYVTMTLPDGAPLVVGGPYPSRAEADAYAADFLARRVALAERLAVWIYDATTVVATH